MLPSMPEVKPARVTIRMAPQLYEALTATAAESGCSFNAFAVQVLAAAAGHRTRFRGTAESGPTRDEVLGELRTLARRDNGYPVSAKERHRHMGARDEWRETMLRDMEVMEVAEMERRINKEEPWFYVEWKMAQAAKRKGE
jgi:hypothetical protein